MEVRKRDGLVFSSRGWRGGRGAEAGLSRFPSCSIGESDESSESFIHGVRVRKPLGDIRREHDHITSGCIAFGVLSPDSLAEIIFRQHVHAPLTLGVLHSCSFPTILTSVFDGDGEAEAEGVQEGVEASKLGIAPVGQHAVETLAVELGRLSELRDPALGLSDVS